MKKNIVIIVLAVLLVIVSVGFGVMYFNTNKDVNVNNEPPIVDNNQHQEENNNQQQTEVIPEKDNKVTGKVLKPTVLNFVRSNYFGDLADDKEFAGYASYYFYGQELVECTQEEIAHYESLPKDMLDLYTRYEKLEFGANFVGDGSTVFPLYKYTATRTLKENNELYDVKNLFLEKTTKSWVEGANGYGIGEKITIDCAYVNEWYYDWENDTLIEKGDFSERKISEACKNMYNDNKNVNAYYYITEVCIENGFCKSEELWKKNSRVKQMKLTFTWKNERVEYILNLEDTMKPQIFSTPFNAKGIDAPIKATFEILDVYKGTTYEDTALTTLELLGDVEGISHGR